MGETAFSRLAGRCSEESFASALATGACALFLSVALLPVPSASGAEAPPLGSPIDRFEHRHQIGEEGVLSLLGGTTPDSLQLQRLKLNRNFFDDTVLNPPELVTPPAGQAPEFGTQASAGSADFVEADLDMFEDDDGNLRDSLEPGVAYVGEGVTSAGCLNATDFCLTWLRPSYTPVTDQDNLRDHEFAGSFQRFGLRFPNFFYQPASGTDVAIAEGTFDPNLGPSLVVAWIQTQLVATPQVRVAHVVAQRNGAGRVQGLQLVDPPGADPGYVDLGPAYEDPNLGLTSPSLAVGDFAGTGTDQIAVAWAPAATTPADPKFSTALLDADSSGALQQAIAPQALDVHLDPNLYSTSPAQITPGAVALRDTRGAAQQPDWLVVGTGVEGDENLHHMLPSLDGAGSFNEQLHFNKSIDNVSRTHHSELESLGDLDGDGLDEILSSARSEIAHDNNSRIEVIKLLDSGPFAGQYEVKSAVVGGGFADTAVIDARRTADQRIAPVPGKTDIASMPQIAVAQVAGGCTTTTGVAGRSASLRLWSLDSDLKPEARGGSHPLSECRSSLTLPEIGAFALDGRFELGEPAKKRYTQLEPSVVLNSPPTHFDILDGTAYDPNFCYAGNQYLVPPVCFFDSQYEREQTAATEVTSEATEDWAVSAKASLGFNVLDVVDVSAEIRGGYGEKFTKIDGATTKDTVTVTVTSRNTDKIYGIKRTYDTLEYPLYQPGGSEPIQYVLTTTPHTIAKRWIDSSSPDAVDVKVNHQPGNILSYPENVTAQENPFVSPTLGTNGQQVDTFAQDEFELSDFSDYKYALTQERLQEDSAAEQKEWNVGATLNASGKGIVEVSAEVSGDYKDSDLTTTKTSAGTTTKLTSTMQGIDESFGETAYTVKPFAYWTENATLVLDYAVEPSVAPPGAPKTWWQQMYGSKPDLTLNLPRLLDYEEQAGISSDAARFISPGVSVLAGDCTGPTPLDPRYAEPGEPLCLRAQVENYSLKNQPAGSTTVEFYDADPDVGGKLLGSADVPAVPARESAVAELDWTPDARFAGTSPRIFAKVDASDDVSEIHEENNKGFRSYGALADSAQAPRAPDDVLAEAGPDGLLMVEWTELEALAGTQPPGHSWRIVAYPESGAPPVETTVDGSESSASLLDLPPDRYRVAVFSVAGDQSSPASHPSEPVDTNLESPPHVEITEGPGDGAYTASSVTFEFEMIPAESEAECVVDGFPQACASPLQLSGLEPGIHTIRIRSTSERGVVSTPTHSWLVDSTAPEASLFPLRKLSGKRDPSLRYTGADEGGSALAGYEIKIARVGPRGEFSTDPVLLDPSTDERGTRKLEVPPGATLCSSLRALDGVGNRSSWTKTRCTTRAVDESALASKGRWKKVSGRPFSEGHALETERSGPSLTLKVGRTNKMHLLAGRCAGCGKVLVEFQGNHSAIVDLSSIQQRKSQIHAFPLDWPRGKSGRLKLTSLGGGPVRIDGIAALRSRR